MIGNRGVVRLLASTRPQAPFLSRQELHPPMAVPAPTVRRAVVGGTAMVIVSNGSVLEAMVRADREWSVSSSWDAPNQTLRIRVYLPAGASYALVADARDRLNSAAGHWSLTVSQPTPTRHGETFGPDTEWRVVEDLNNGPLPPPSQTAVPKPPPPKPPPDSLPPLELPPVIQTDKIDEVLQHLREDRWDTDDLAAELTNDDMGELGANDRVDMIADIADGWLVGGEDEDTIIRLLEATPPQDLADVAARLLADEAKLCRRLDNVIDGDENVRFGGVLAKLLMSARSPEQLTKEMKDAIPIPWAGNTIGWGIEVEWTKQGKLRIQITTGLKNAPIEVDPNQIIRVLFTRDDPDVGGVEGESLYIPAVSLWSLAHNWDRRQTWLAINVALVVGGAFSGAAAVTTLGRVLAAIDTAAGLAGIAINQYRSEIAKTQEGRDFLAKWDIAQRVIAIYGIARALRSVPAAIKDVRDMWKVYKLRTAGDQAVSLAKAQREMWLNMNKFEQGLADAERQATNLKTEQEFRKAIRELRDKLVTLPTKESRGGTGPVLSGCLDSTTGGIFYGVNQGKVPTKLHPLLKARYEAYLAKAGGATPPRAGVPGAHSEVGALNKALWARDPEGKLKALKEGEFVMHNAQLYRNRPEGVPPKCDNCEGIIPKEVKFLP